MYQSKEERIKHNYYNNKLIDVYNVLLEKNKDKIGTNLQDTKTPMELTNSIVDQLEYYTGLFNKTYLVFNLEFADALIRKGINVENIWFLTDNETKINIKNKINNYDSKPRYRGINTIHQNFETFIIEGIENMKFDVVLMNPPYQAPKKVDSEGRGKNGVSLWDKFVNKSLTLVKQGGFVCNIHPSKWRKPRTEKNIVGNILIDNKLHYLEIHGLADAKSTFNCQTRYDWYILEKGIPDENFETTIVDEEGVKSVEKLSQYNYIPNARLNDVYSLVAKEGEDRVDLVYSSSLYDQRKPTVSSVKDSTFNFPCVYSIKKNGDITFKYSSENKGHFGIPKVIWPTGAFQSVDCLVDTNGEYGLTPFARGIRDEPKNLPNIYKALRSKKFLELYPFLTMGVTELDKDIIKTFRKDFWKEFI